MMKLEYERHHGEYDIVVRFRPDMCLVSRPPLHGHHSTLTHHNPPRIYYANRVYDIFFYGSSAVMNIMSKAWIDAVSLCHDPFDNGLKPIDCCRLLYLQALRHNVRVIDDPIGVGDIYRDENMSEYIKKILHWNTSDTPPVTVITRRFRRISCQVNHELQPSVQKQIRPMQFAFTRASTPVLQQVKNLFGRFLVKRMTSRVPFIRFRSVCNFEYWIPVKCCIRIM